MTNPNPVAPKTDTPATQIPDDLKGDYQRACMQHKGHRGYVQGLIERIGLAESTLAAESAERFNAGIEAALEAVVDQRPMQYEEIIKKFDDLDYSGYARACMHIEADIRALMKPSVSPEQAEETK